jgi:hypothetical protein
VTRQTTRFQALAAFAAVAAAAAIASPVALPAKAHAFTATYTGSGTGEVSGTSASGHATAAGRGSIIGAGTLSGSGRGVFTSQTCVTFNGTAVLKGKPGSIRLAARGARACTGGPDAKNVSFSGSAKVTGGTSTFEGAHGTLSFAGSYVNQSGALTISFKGRISY